MSRPSSVRLLADQARYQVRLFVRTPIALFFTVALPLIMLVVFNAVFSGQTVEMGGGDLPLSQFYVGGLAAFTAASATFTNLANTIPIRREDGILKRWRSTPIPPWVVVGGYLIGALLIALIGTVLVVGVGVIFYDIQLDAAKVPALAISFVVGVSAFALLGIAVASLIRSADAAPAVANALILPLAFISNVFIPIENPAPVIKVLSGVFPLQPFARSFQDVFNPAVDAPALHLGRLAVVAAWGVVGALFAVRHFRWEPYGAGRTRSRRGRGGTSVPADAP